jgi:hypothetical protein
MGGFAARTATLEINSTGGLDWDRNFQLGSLAKNPDGTFYADKPVDLALPAGLSLSATRTIYIASTGPGTNGAAGTGIVQKISAGITGAGAPAFSSVGSFSRSGPVAEVVLLGTNNWTGTPTVTDGSDSTVNAGPGGLLLGRNNTSYGVFVRFASDAAFPTGNGGSPAWLACDLKGNEPHFTGGFLLTSSTVSGGAVYDLPTGYKFLIGSSHNPQNPRSGVLGATSDDGNAGKAVLQNSSVILLRNSGNDKGYGMLARDGEFVLGTTSGTGFGPVTFEVATRPGATFGPTTIVDPATDFARTLVKLGSGTVVLQNVEYKLTVAGTDMSSNITWQVGYMAGNGLYEGALRETGSDSTNSVTNTMCLALRGGVVELANDLTRSFGTGAGQIDMAGGTVDPFTDSLNNTVHAAIVSNSTAAPGLDILAGSSNTVASITGTGKTAVEAGASLTAGYIIQDTLTLGAGATVTITTTTAGASAPPLGSGLGGVSAGGAVSQVPEPGTLALLLSLAGAALAAWTWRRR